MWKTSEIAGFVVTIPYLSAAAGRAIVWDDSRTISLPPETAVLESDRTLRHLAFFEELAALDESDAEWRSVSAGLVVLRLVDAWMEEGPHTVTGDAWGLRAVRVTIEEIDDGKPVRALLGSVVDAMEDSAVSDMSAVAPRLLAYGRALEYEARYALAAEVYRAVIAHTHPVEESDIATTAHLQLGACLRTSGNLAAAASAYEVAGRIAQASDDIVGVLRSRIGDAKIALARGNLPRAEQLLDSTIAESTEHEMTDVRSMALHDRATVAYYRGDYDRTIRFAYEAMNTATSPRERDRILGDLATAFMELGVHTAARDAYLVLTVTAQEQATRWYAQLHLMDLAARDGSEPLFERYRRDLADASLPPTIAVEFFVHAGEGYQRFGRTALGCGYLERALAIAKEHQFNQIMFHVEEVLQQAGSVARASHHISVSPSAEVQLIADELRRMRELAGAST
jgi:tetratricopeptide (TPR) repeat protein